MLSSLSIHGIPGASGDHYSFSPLSAIIGTNGSGKTHILEAIHIASGGALHTPHGPRTGDSEVELTVATDLGPKSYTLARKAEKDIYTLQGKAISGVKYRESLPFRTVFVSPFDMNLLYFAPAIRRDYIDSILARTFAQFSKTKRDYLEVMRQRNALLKKIREGEGKPNMLDAWDDMFVEKAILYDAYRRKWVDWILTHMDELSSFLPKYTLSFSYQASIEEKWGEPWVREYLREHRERDILSGHTHVGPHLDDFTFFIEDTTWLHESSFYLSRGENKTLLLAMKNLEISFLRTYLSLPIILLFDDVFAELDETNALRVIENFQAEQTIVTTQRSLVGNGKWQYFSCINLENR